MPISPASTLLRTGRLLAEATEFLHHSPGVLRLIEAEHGDPA